MISALLNLPLAKSKAKIEAAIAKQKHLLLTAPTGTGKSSFLPWLLAGENKRVVVLQPRQLAARELAKFLSKHLGEETVGYKFRFESKQTKNTRILFQTYGSFLQNCLNRDFQDSEINWIVFDEFHERRAEMDLLLGMALASGQRVAVLSAELEREALEKYLGVECLRIENPGFPVEVIHQEGKAGEPLASQVERAVKSILYNEIDGTILVFLPGKAEIAACRERVAESLGKNSPQLFSLFGGQLKEEQEKIFEPNENTRIIFTTNIAETSLTIPNVKAVIDSGFERMAFDDSATGLKTLRLARIAMQNAVQRTGRAGRTQKGLCIRLWSEREELNFAQAIKPEIERINTARFLLQKMQLESSLKKSISLLDTPPFKYQELENLNLISQNKITELGEKTLRIPVQSLELARALALQKTLSKSILAMAVILESENKTGNIIHLAEDFLEGRGKWQREEKLHFEQLLKYSVNPVNSVNSGSDNFLLEAFPNSLAYKSDNEQYYKTKDGLSVFCESKEKAILVLGLMRSESHKLQKTTASLYAPVPEKYLQSGQSRLELQWKAREKQFVAMRVDDFGKTECSTEERKSLEKETAAAWLALMEKEDFGSQWQTEANLALLAKMKLASQLFPEHNFPKWDAEDFALAMDEFCTGVFLLRELSEERYKKIIEDYFGVHWLSWLDKNFPSSLKLPNGRIAKYIYNSDGVVELSARIGDFMGMQGEHFIAEQRLRVRYDILAPNYRTAQKTWNLSDFWKNTYPEVRKELRGRYPKHPWPIIEM
uniref:ATP-dependent helicase HrpB n=1 Tax=uncultured bacterium contig00029 TaxID=1181518 RepID=A0A806JYL4_9BACT|nr:ATP-dependent helicase HrpB [uncultured bacterium contig00029]